MAKGLEALRNMEYPGRVIIIGKNLQGYDVAMYAITGRSPSSQARRLEIDREGRKVFVKPTDEETLKTGQPELLVYSAILYDKGMVVGNGKQTGDINANMDRERLPIEVLLEGQRSWDYEPDEPNFTPRISGCITGKGAALSVTKRAEDGSVIKHYFDIPMMPGKGKMIATYTGINDKPLPSFTGEPIDVEITSASADECVETMYEALGPAGGQPDFRVVAASAFVDKEGTVSAAVKNRHDL
jgi:IMP cyclohydrolase